MKRNFEILKTSQQNICTILDGMTLEAINEIPENYSNNLAWNFGHIIVTQQLLFYKLSNLTPKIKRTLIDKYKKESKPTEAISAQELSDLKEMMVSFTILSEEDYNNGVFKEYAPYMTSYNVELRTIEDAISFNNVHTGIHFGYMLCLKKALSTST